VEQNGVCIVVTECWKYLY